MTICSAINFGLSALNLGVMIWGLIYGSSWGWIANLTAMVFCFCMGLYTLN